MTLFFARTALLPSVDSSGPMAAAPPGRPATSPGGAPFRSPGLSFASRQPPDTPLRAPRDAAGRLTLARSGRAWSLNREPGAQRFDLFDHLGQRRTSCRIALGAGEAAAHVMARAHVKAFAQSQPVPSSPPPRSPNSGGWLAAIVRHVRSFVRSFVRSVLTHRGTTWRDGSSSNRGQIIQGGAR